MIEFGLAHQIKAIDREIALRLAVYPRRIRVGKMSVKEADYQLAVMREVLRTLQRLAREALPEPMRIY
jgi:hypothetical protein